MAGAEAVSRKAWNLRYNKSPKGLARSRAYLRRRRELNRAAGICIDCCKHPVALGHSKCEECRARDNERRWLA